MKSSRMRVTQVFRIAVSAEAIAKASERLK